MKCFASGKYGQIKAACPLVKEAQNEIKTDSGQVLNGTENNDQAKVTSAVEQMTGWRYC